MTKLYHYNTLASLMAGLYKGTLPIKDLLKHGNFGIGTLDSLDGELIILDGKAYQAKGDKTIRQVSGEETVPYAAVLNHQADIEFEQSLPILEEALKEKITEQFISKNLFYSIKIKGNFAKVHVRMAPRSEQGTPFVQVAKNQPEYHEENVSGTIVGVWTPDLFDGVSVKGFHLHFISDDFAFGGHLLDFTMTDGQVEIGNIMELVQDFPFNDKAFLSTDIDVEQSKKDIAITE